MSLLAPDAAAAAGRRSSRASASASRCYAKDDFEPIRLSDRVGTVKSFTFDNFAGSPNPPMVAGIVDVEGARLYVQMTDVAPKEVKLGMPVELTFRKIHEAGGTPNYFWKSTPVR